MGGASAGIGDPFGRGSDGRAAGCCAWAAGGCVPGRRGPLATGGTARGVAATGGDRTPDGGRAGCNGMASCALICGVLAISGNMPSMGPMRAITRPAAGATTQPAVA